MKTSLIIHEYRSTLKSGKPGNRWLIMPIFYCPLSRCDLCGVLGGAHKVTSRSGIYRWNAIDQNDYSTPSLDNLCVGCWNGVRPIVRLHRLADEIGLLGRKLKREAATYGKQIREASGLSDRFNRAGQIRRIKPGEGVGDGQAGGPGECVAEC